MEPIEIKGEAYTVSYDPTAGVVVLQGELRLWGRMAYRPIRELLDEAITTIPETVTLDIRELRFADSSGIDLLHGFVIKLRGRAGTRLTVRGSAQIPWHERLFSNMQLLMPGLQVELEPNQ